MYIMPALLILAIGTSIAPVAGGFQDGAYSRLLARYTTCSICMARLQSVRPALLRTGWVKYSSSNVKVPAIVRLLAGAHPGKAIPIQIWVGWIRSHNTLSSLINTRTHGSYPKWLWDKVWSCLAVHMRFSNNLSSCTACPAEIVLYDKVVHSCTLIGTTVCYAHTNGA